MILFAQPRMAFEVNSVPLSDTIIRGLPRAPTSIVNSRATCLPEIEVSGIAARHTRVTSSTMLRMRKCQALGELVMDEAERPARVDLGLDQDRRARSDRFPPSLALADVPAFFFAVEPIDAVDA